MKYILTLTLINLFTFNLALAGVTDTHPQLCENIRTQLEEDCSEEPNTFDKATDARIKRSYQECFDQDFASILEDLNRYLTYKLGIYTFDATGDKDQIECKSTE